MTISFSGIPTTLRLPSVAAEFDNTRAQQGPAILAYKALIIGQKTSAGTGTINTIVRVTSVDQVITLGGRGSMLHRQAIAWFNNNRSTEVYIGILDDNAAGVLATKTLTFTGSTTAAGTFHLYVGGTYVPVAFASGLANTAQAAAVEAALDLYLDLPVVASVASDVVTLTARNKGVEGQNLDVRVNYQFGEALPAGTSVAIANVVSGITNPVLTTLIAAMGDTWYNVIAHCYTDATSLTALETELTSRFAAARMIDGIAITSSVGSASTLGTIGDSRNSAFTVLASQPGSSPVTPPCEFAAAVAAVVAYNGAADPARPFQTLALNGVKAPATANLFTAAERNLELYDGVSTSKVAAGGVVQLERMITTYKTSAAGADDTSYLDVTTLLTLAYVRYSLRTQLQNAFPRHKLAADGTRFGAGQAVVTPKIIKAECFAWFRALEQLGLVEGFDQFKADLVVERNVSDASRVDILLPPDLVNGLIVTAISVQFRL